MEARKATKRTKMILIRVSEEEQDDFKKRAMESGMNVSQWIRWSLINGKKTNGKR